jgi:hypothetical protein
VTSMVDLKLKWCPPYCDGGPDGGIHCGGGANHKPGWPDGLPYEQDVIVGEDGTTLSPSVTRWPDGRMQVSLIIRWDGEERTVWLSEKAAELFGDSAAALFDLAFPGNPNAGPW